MLRKKKTNSSQLQIGRFAFGLALIVGSIVSYHHRPPSQSQEGWESRPGDAPRFPQGTLRRKDDLNTRLRPDPVDGRKKIRLNVRGSSMRPELNPGDRIVTYVDEDIRQAKLGQWVTFIADLPGGQESYYTHKIVAVYYDSGTGQRELVTRGINNIQNDRERVTEENFIGISRKF